MADAECSQKAIKRNKRQQMAAEAIAMASIFQQNRGVYISEPQMAASGTNDQNSRTKGKGKSVVDMGEMMKDQNSEPKGKVKDKVIFDRDEMMTEQNSKRKGKATRKPKTSGPKMVKFNELGQPVGKKAAPFAHFLSKIAQGYVALTIPIGIRLSLIHTRT